jgi:hypothetical protein
VDKLREMFFISDLAKFAKYTPQPDENEMSLSNIYTFVEKTMREVNNATTESVDETPSEKCHSALDAESPNHGIAGQARNDKA